MNRKILIIGPCAAESREQMQAVVSRLTEVLADESAHAFDTIIRAGLWKPRSSPLSFQGVGEEGLPWLMDAAKQTHLPVATEVAQPEHLIAAYRAGIRHVWIGARTSTNPFMIDALASTPIADKQAMTWYIKNPTSPDINLWCGAIERLKQAGYDKIRAIHRGFAMGEHTTSKYRNAPMWSIAIELKHRYPDLPLLTDVSHMAGDTEHISEIAEQTMRMGIDGLMIEVHHDPQQALSDAKQQLTPDQLLQLLRLLAQIDTRCQQSEGNELVALRQQIDETDDELWALIGKRMNISRQIGEYKRRNAMPVLQQDRYNEVLERRMHWAAEHGIQPEAAKQIMDIIHEQSVLTQTHI